MNDGTLLIGLGRMGLPIALRLRQAGVPLVVHDLDAGPLEKAAAAGASIAVPAQLHDLPFTQVLLCLPSPAAVSPWIAQWAALPRRDVRTVVADFTTSAPSQAGHAQRALEAANLGYLDCPLSGGEVGAATGDLVLLAGGAAEDFRSIEALLRQVANFVRHTGGAGSASLLKAVNQSVYLSYNYAFAKGVELAIAQGLPQELVLDALTRGAAGHPLINQRLGRLPGAAASGPFTVERALKDLQFLELAPGDDGTPTPPPLLHALLLEEFSRAVSEGKGKSDLFHLARNLR